MVIDLETTGLHPAEAKIIELAALRVEDGTPSAEFQRLIRINQPLSEAIVQLTGICDQELCEKGVSLASAVSAFFAFIGKDVLVSHNASFDQRFLIAACRQLNLPPFCNRIRDTLALARHKLPNAPNYKLSTLAEYFDIQSGHSHRALADCYTTYSLYLKLNEI